MALPTLILASASPRRSELLRAAGIDFTVRVANVDETQWPAEAPDAYVARLSRIKALAVAQPDEIVLGADTTVVINAETAGKTFAIGGNVKATGQMRGMDDNIYDRIKVTEGGNDVPEPPPSSLICMKPRR